VNVPIYENDFDCLNMNKEFFLNDKIINKVLDNKYKIIKKHSSSILIKSMKSKEII
jgi:hypothetical protein